MANLHIKKGDTVVVLSGDDKGVKGEVLAVSPAEGKVIVKDRSLPPPPGPHRDTEL